MSDLRGDRLTSMNATRRRFLEMSAISGLAALDSVGWARGDEEPRRKRALAILGDAYHCVAPLHEALVRSLLRRGYAAVTIMDYSVPFDEFSGYDLIVLSRYAYDDVSFYRERDVKPGTRDRARWLTAEQEEKFAEYVETGGRLFLHHDGIGFYPKDGAISRLARAYFIKHPPIFEEIGCLNGPVWVDSSRTIVGCGSPANSAKPSSSRISRRGTSSSLNPLSW